MEGCQAIVMLSQRLTKVNVSRPHLGTRARPSGQGLCHTNALPACYTRTSGPGFACENAILDKLHSAPMASIMEHYDPKVASYGQSF